MVGSVILVEQNRFIKLFKYAFTFVVMLETSNIVFKSSNHDIRGRQHVTKATHARFVSRVYGLISNIRMFILDGYHGYRNSYLINPFIQYTLFISRCLGKTELYYTCS